MIKAGTLTEAQKENQTIDIRPTLLIGLGGTGKGSTAATAADVLREVQSSGFTRHGIPMVRY